MKVPYPRPHSLNQKLQEGIKVTLKNGFSFVMIFISSKRRQIVLGKNQCFPIIMCLLISGAESLLEEGGGLSICYIVHVEYLKINMLWLALKMHGFSYQNTKQLTIRF